VNRRLLLCSDLDRTILPNGPQSESKGARTLFAALAARPEVTLVYVTGRDRHLVTQAIENYCLPQPDYVISDVGTSIYEVAGDSWQRWHQWQQEIAPDWNGLSDSDIRALLLDIVELQAQEPAKQNLYKSSYYVPLYADTEALTHDIRQRLEHSGVSANLVWSIDEPRGTGLLDVLPASASKEHAIRFLMQRNGFELTDTVFAGDSGNDLPVLASEIPAVLVANASAEVRNAALTRAESGNTGDALYIARGGFMGMNGNYTAGVLEGVVYYRPDVRSWLADSAAEVPAND
jgi:HAD superfamily hydrolase (TIGR01484 family)